MYANNKTCYEFNVVSKKNFSFYFFNEHLKKIVKHNDYKDKVFEKLVFAIKTNHKFYKKNNRR